MKTLNFLKQSKYSKLLFIAGILITSIATYSITPQKEYFVCQNRWSPVSITLVIRSYAFGMKHSINEFNVLQCKTNSDSIFCNDSFSSFKFDRITADYDVFKPAMQLYRCQKTNLQI